MPADPDPAPVLISPGTTLDGAPLAQLYRVNGNFFWSIDGVALGPPLLVSALQPINLP